MLLASPLTGGRLPVRSFTYADGLGRDLATCILEDNRGFLWLCTAEGLSRFDGYRFVTFSTSDGLPHRTITAAVETSDSTLIVATEAGLARLDPTAPDGSPKRFAPISIPGDARRGILTLFAGRDDVVWAGSYGGMYRLSSPGKPSEKLEWLALKSILAVSAFAEDEDGNLWIGASEGLFRRARDGTIHNSKLPGTPVRRLLLAKQGHLWAGTSAGLWKLHLSGGEAILERAFGEADGLASLSVHALHQTPDGCLWVGTALSLSKQVSGDRFQSYGRSDGIPGRAVLSLATDRGGNLWAGADHGLVRVARDGFQAYSEADGIGERAISTILEDPAGKLYAVSNQLGGPRIHELKGTRFSEILPRSSGHLRSSGWGWTQAALIDRTGAWWIATGEGLLRYPPGLTAAALANASPQILRQSHDIFRIFEDSRGDIWVSSVGRSSARWERSSGRWIEFTDPPLPGIVSAFAEDRAGNVWLGVSNEAGTGRSCAVARYRDGHFEIWKSGGASVPSGWISSLLIDRDGRLWIGSGDNGLAVVDNPVAPHPVFKLHPAKLNSVAVRCLAADNQGRIYASGPRGLVRLDPTSGQLKHYSTAQGYPPGACGALHFDRQGRLWAGSSLGLARLDPSPDHDNPSPHIYITSVTFNGEAQILSGAHSFPSAQNHMRIEYVSAEAVSGSQLEYRYRLEGGAASLIRTTEDRNVEYANLAPGQYRFEVRARSEDGHESATPSSFNFEILPPLWKRTWFIALVLTSIAAAAFLAQRLQSARQLELERIRTRIAADLHDDLGASLTRVAILAAAPYSPSESALHLQQIAETARGLIDSMGDVVWAVDPRHDDLGSLLRRIRQVASELLEPQGIGWTLSAPPEISDAPLRADQRRHLFLIAKEAVRNAARHARAQSVAMALDLARDELRFQITDDGCGFDPSSPRQGNGLNNLQARAAALGATLTLNSQPGQGVIILLRLPLRWHDRALGKYGNQR